MWLKFAWVPIEFAKMQLNYAEKQHIQVNAGYTLAYPSIHIFLMDFQFWFINKPVNPKRNLINLPSFLPLSSSFLFLISLSLAAQLSFTLYYTLDSICWATKLNTFHQSLFLVLMMAQISRTLGDTNHLTLGS